MMLAANKLRDTAMVAPTETIAATLETIKLLIRKGADLDVLDENGDSVFDWIRNVG